MDNSVQKKYGSTLVYALIAMIMAGFLFTGFEAFTGGGSLTSIGSVNGEPISFNEFNNAYNNQTNYLSKMFGGKPLTQQQIQQFKVKESTIDRLVNTKLLYGLAQESGITPSTKELKKTIKELDYFQTNKQFDVSKYKNLLKANGLSISDFEKSISENSTVQTMSGIINSLPVFNNSIESKRSFQNSGFKADLVKFSRNGLREFIPVSEKEVNDFLADAKNEDIIKGLYKEKSAEYMKEEERKARHILFSTKGDKKEIDVKVLADKVYKQLNKGNFSTLAKQYTEDPSGKTNGGELGWFTKGRMVPAFSQQTFSMKVGDISKPVKTNFGYHIIILDGIKAAKTTPLAEVRNKLAKDHLRNGKNTELTEFSKTLSEDLKKAFDSKNTAKINELTKKYKLDFKKDQEITVYNIQNQFKSLNLEEFSSFSKMKESKIFNNIENFTVAMSKGSFSKKLETKDKKDNTEVQNFQRTFATEVIKKLKDKARINISSRI